MTKPQQQQIYRERIFIHPLTTTVFSVMSDRSCLTVGESIQGILLHWINMDDEKDLMYCNRFGITAGISLSKILLIFKIFFINLSQ